MITIRFTCGVLFLLMFNILWISDAKDVKTDFTTSPTPITTLQRTTSVAEGFNSDAYREGLTKRDTKAADLSASPSVSAKSYDPPPEFYRGPGSTGSVHAVPNPYYSSSDSSSNNKLTSGFISKPIAFPTSSSKNTNKNNNNYSPPDNGIHLANSYNSWQHLRNKTAFFGALLNKTGLQDRISVGHYGNPLHGGGHGVEYVPSGGAHHYSSPHAGPYSVAHPHVDYHHGGGPYYPGHGSSSPGDGIPFDVYGGGKGHYAGSGGEYSYTYSDMHETAAHKTFPDFSHKALLAKSFLIPLASAAVLGIAAALVSNPLLLQLGTVSGVATPGTVIGKRKRRATSSPPTPKAEPTTDSKETLVHPYRGHHRRFGRVRT
ncbi:uncharacterized protein LOC101895149 [Musca domestica]|uniref:Uncharacterized protein LOC101895149 n=1 Tax=Musca domestica TaxID=7370 RepID=A0A9J7CX10_MUSDO|nr:uncharacterized protein LOC101895149 [Musca domestica]